MIQERGIEDGTIAELVIRHEQQHNETMLQTMQLAHLDPFGGTVARQAPVARVPHLTGLEFVEVPGGECVIGAPSIGFAYDNERPRHRTDVRAYLIGQTPITNASYLTFVEGGGYERREWWSDEGWAWKEEYDITRPHAWTADLRSEWRLGRLEPLHPHHPVVHVSWFEADAFARAHDARLPTECEWEKAATWDQTTGEARAFPWGEEPLAPGRRANVDQLGLGPVAAGALADGASPCNALGMIGDVWEWTSSHFDGYPDFIPYPYKEYSQVFFGPDHRDAARRLLGHACARDHAHLPQLGLPRAAADLLWNPNREGCGVMRSLLTTDQIQIDSWLSASEERILANDVLDGLTRPFKELPPKHFYDARGSELFDRICELPEYYPTRTEKAILASRAAEIIDLTGAGELVELGSGSAEKARVLLDAMANAGTLRRYVPLDVSETVVRDAAEQLIDEYDGLLVHGVIGDFQRHLGQVPGADGVPRLVALLGGTIGNFPPGTRRGLLRQVQLAAGPGGPVPPRDRPREGPGGDRGGLRRQRRRDRGVQPQRAARDQSRARRRLPPGGV